MVLPAASAQAQQAVQNLLFGTSQPAGRGYYGAPSQQPYAAQGVRSQPQIQQPNDPYHRFGPQLAADRRYLNQYVSSSGATSPVRLRVTAEPTTGEPIVNYDDVQPSPQPMPSQPPMVIQEDPAYLAEHAAGRIERRSLDRRRACLRRADVQPVPRRERVLEFGRLL